MVYELWHVIVAVIIGGIIGWVLSLLISRDNLQHQESIWKAKLASMESEHEYRISTKLDEKKIKIEEGGIKSNQGVTSLHEKNNNSTTELLKTEIQKSNSGETGNNGDIEMIEGIGPVYGKKLRSIGISWVKELLEYGGSATGRKKIVEKIGLKPDQILKWVNAADLLRINGMTPDWAELLEASGVDTIKELRTRVAENLHKKIQEVNPTNPHGSYARTTPDLTTVQNWIEQAKTIEAKITY